MKPKTMQTIKKLLKSLMLYDFYKKVKGKYLRITDKYYDVSPSLIADYLKDIIKDKSICDLGCRKGHLMKQFLKYTKDVLGIELEKEYYNACVKEGLNVIYADYYKVDLPRADIYYIWAVNEVRQKVLEKLKDQGLSGLYIMRLDPKEQIVFNEPVIDIPSSKREEIKLQIVKI
jgi:hypothetical protein